MALLALCTVFAAGPAASSDGPPADIGVAVEVDPGAQSPGEMASPTMPDDLELEIDARPASFPDPFESVNRHTLTFNQRVDRWIISPVARAYGVVVPDAAKSGIRNFFSNLGAPVRLLNDVLQAEWQDAGATVSRFGINTLAGFAGLVDTADYLGIPPHQSDFGETLASTGMGSGPFLVVPVLGPTTLRDGVGSLVDTAMNPANYLTFGVSPLLVATIGSGAEGLVEREAVDRDLARLEQGSVDYYAALRSAYYQNRMAEISAARPSSPAPPT